ncbi:MAG: hypothetical protein LQ342_005265 [Letrouitia transgressa]|nr:MAG: hypothetical protein LQ342_005265 [Letrouitia transgressa]
MGKIAVFPASGSLGSSIYKHLLDIVDAGQVILISRHPAKIPSKYTQKGAITRRADYDAPGTLNEVFDGVHKYAIEAAIRSGVSHIFYTSLAFGGDGSSNSAAHVMQSHLQTEAYLKSLAVSSTAKSRFSFTAIREGLYSESFPMYTGYPNFQNPGSRVQIPHNGLGPGVAWAKIDDLGEATAKLVQEYCHGSVADHPEYKDQVVLLSGPRAYSLAETLDVLGTAMGTEIVIENVSVSEYASEPIIQKHLAPHGQEDAPTKWATSFEAVRKGEAAVTSVRLERLLGRKPESFETTVATMVNSSHY